MYDQRNHGNSGPGTCQWITGGVEESKDVLAAVNFITHHSDYQDSPIGLLSFCQGANATTYAYGRENGLAAIANLKALIAIQPMYNNSTFLRAFGFSNNQVAKANQLNLDRGGRNIEQSCWDHVGKINVPTLLLQADDDPWTNLDKVKEYYDLLNVEKQIAWIKCGGKRLAAYSHFEHSPELMLEWFRKYV